MVLVLIELWKGDLGRDLLRELSIIVVVLTELFQVLVERFVELWREQLFKDRLGGFLLRELSKELLNDLLENWERELLSNAWKREQSIEYLLLRDLAC